MVQKRFSMASAVIAVALMGVAANAAAPKIEAVPGEYVVKMSKAQNLKSANSLRMFGAQQVRAINEKENVYLVKRNMIERSEYALNSLSAMNGVEIVEPNYIYRINRTPNDPKLGELWGLKNTGTKGREGMDIGAEAAWDIQTGSRNIIVAVIDTGLDYTHTDLAANSWTNAAELNGQAGVDDDGNGYVDDIHGYDFANNDGDPMDDHGHGSHCSGTIGAKGDDGIGIVGVNWDVQIMGVKFLTGGGSGTLEDAIKAIDYATKMHANIMSNSWGGGGYSETLKQAIERARDAGILFVAAAGNETNDNDANPMYPATYQVENVVSVAALDAYGQLAYFSNWGKKTVHVAAPGVDVYSSIPGGYDAWSGTSMATPHVSGVAALLLANEPNATYADIKARLMATAKPVTSIRERTVSGGIVNAFYALTNQVAPPDLEDPFNWEAQAHSYSSAHPYGNSAALSFQVSVPGASKVAVFFEKFDTERGYDFVEFKDAQGNVVGRWSGGHDGEFSPVVSGDTIYMTFSSDQSVDAYGFDITKVAYK